MVKLCFVRSVHHVVRDEISPATLLGFLLLLGKSGRLGPVYPQHVSLEAGARTGDRGVFGCREVNGVRRHLHAIFSTPSRTHSVYL